MIATLSSSNRSRRSPGDAERAAGYISSADGSVIQSCRPTSSRGLLNTETTRDRDYTEHLETNEDPPELPRLRDESHQPRALLPDKRRQPVGPRSDLPEQDPRRRPPQPAAQHERLLLQAAGARAQHPAEQEREQDGDPAACDRLHPGPAARAGLQCRDNESAARAAPAERAQHGHQRAVPPVSGVSVRPDR